MTKLFSSLIHRFKKLTLIGKVIVLGILFGSGLLIRSRFTSSSDTPTYQYGTVQTGNIIQTVSETGEIMSTNKTEISTSINGIIKEVYVENGQETYRGQSLFYVTSTATEADRAGAYASYLSAKTNLESAKAKQLTLESSMWKAHETFEADSLDTELSVDDPIFIQTQRDWLAAEKTYIDQKQVISQAQAGLTNAWLSYQAMIDGPVKATSNGTVANLSLAPGQKVQAADTALIITSDAETWVKVAINENDIKDVEPGQRATITIDALEETVPATVKRVDEYGTVVSDVALYYVYLTLDETSSTIRPSMTAQVDIVTQEKQDVLVIDSTAIKPYQGETAVQTLDTTTDTVIYKPISTGVSDDTKTEIISGLTEGEQIITSQTSSQTESSGGLFGGSRPN